MAEGQITRRDIIEDEALKWGGEYAKTLDLAISKNKEFVDGIISMKVANEKLRASEDKKDYIENLRNVEIESKKTIASIKEQLVLETSLEKIKKEKISTSKVELDLNVKKAKAAKELSSLMAVEEKLNQEKLKTEKERIILEKQIADLEIKKQQLKNAGLAVTKSELDLIQKEEIIKKNKLAILEKEASKLKAQQIISKENIYVWKEQNQAEQALISTKRKNQLATESTNRSLTKERVLLQETNKEIKLQARESLGLVSTYEKLNRSRNEAQTRLANLLSAEKRSTAEIIVAQREFNKLDIRVKAVDASINNYSKNIGNYGSAFKGLNSTARELLSTFGLVSGLALFGTVIKDVFGTVKDFDRQLIAVGKTTNITGEDLNIFGREVVKLGNDLDGVSVEGLLKSAEVAGTLGVKGTDNILKFSTAIEKLKLTSDIISEEQVQNFAKFIEVSSDSFENADKLASVITQLGNNFATTEAQILSNATEIAKGVAVYNTSAEGVLALGAATSSLGSEAESSRSAIQSTFAIINKAVATGKNLEEVLRLTGLTQAELSKQFNEDATGVFQKFVKGLNGAKQEGENLSLVLEGLGLTEKRAFTVVGSLAANYSVLEGAMASAKQEYIDNIALNKEVEAASQSIASIIGDIKDKFDAYVLSANDANGGTQRLASALKFVRDNLSSIIDGFIKYGAVLLTFLGVQKAITLATALYTAAKVAGTAAQVSFTTATGIGTVAMKAQALAAQEATVSQNALNLATKATPWGIILAALAAVVVAYIAFNDELSDAEKRIERIKQITNDNAEAQKNFSSDGDKSREKSFKLIEDEIALRKAEGENSKKLDQEEIQRKKDRVIVDINSLNNLKNSEIERTANEVNNSKKRIAQAEFEKAALIKANFRRNLNGDSVDDLDKRVIREKEAMLKSQTDNKNFSDTKISELNRFNGMIAELDKNQAIKDAENQTEINKKSIEASKKAEADRIKLLKERYDAEKKLIDDSFKLSQFRLQVAMDVENEIATNEKKSFDERLDSLLLFNQIREAKTKDAAEYELQQLGTYNEKSGKFIRQLSDFEITELLETGKSKGKITDEQRLISEKYQNDLTAFAKKGKDDRTKLIDAEVDAIQKKTDAELQLKTNTLNQDVVGENDRYALELQSAEGNFKLIEAAREEHERILQDIQKKYALDGIQLQIDSIQNTLNANDAKESSEQISAEKRAEIVAKLEAFKREASDLTVQEFDANAQKLVELQKEANEHLTDLAFGLADALVDLTNAIFDARINNIDNEIAANNEFYNTQIEAAGDNERQKKFLEEEREKRNKELEKKRQKEAYKAAVFNRVMAIADIAIKTAQAIMAANLTIQAMNAISFGIAGTTYGAFAIPLILATAGIQAGAVLATPLPKYKHGRKDGPDEFAIVGDGGRPEVVSDPDGSNPRLTPKVPTLTFLRKNERVHSSIDSYEKYVRNANLQSLQETGNKARDYQMNVNVDNAYGKEMLFELRENTKAIKHQKNSTTVNIPKIDLGHEFWKMKNTRWN